MHEDSRAFVTLADVLRAQGASEPISHARAAPVAPTPIDEAASPSFDVEVAREAAFASAEPDDRCVRAAIREARLFRAAVADALDARLADVVAKIAVDVLGRELRLGPVDIEAIVRRLIVEHAAHEPVRIRLAPGDALPICELPVIIDPSLGGGDAVLECRSGGIDARLGVRLAAVLAEVRG